MYRHIIQRSSFALLGSAVLVNTADSSKDNEDKSWKDLIPSFFSSDSKSTDSSDVKSLTGWDRLYIMYTKDEFGHLSKELNSVLYITYSSFFAGSFYGVISRTKEAHQEFLERNQATQFANIFEARKAMQDKVLKAGFKGMFFHGCRLGLFCGGILTVTLSLMTFFNSTSVIHYGIAAGTIGAIHRWRMGPRGILVGGMAGGILGLMAGGMTKGLFYVFDVDIHDVISYQSDVMLSREKQWSDLQQKAIDEKNNNLTPLLKEHDIIVEETAKEVKKVDNVTEASNH